MYRVQLNNFEGPLDLLLFFIKRDELDIYDIPISYITEQFLEFIQLMEELDLDVASEFVLMASMLMSIKAKMMLPREEGEDAEEIDETDPSMSLFSDYSNISAIKRWPRKWPISMKKRAKNILAVFMMPTKWINEPPAKH